MHYLFIYILLHASLGYEMSNSFPLFSYNYIDFILIFNFDFMPGPTNYKVFERYHIKVIKYLSFHKVV